MKEDLNDDLIRVEGEQHLYRDRETGAILNTDSSGYNQYVKMKKRRQTQKEELDTLKKDIEEIKSLLKEIANGPK
jgi:SPX domain protein involved in polyphosphate accumulation